MAALIQEKASLLWLAENVVSPIKLQQATSGTSAATHKVMEPHWSNVQLNELQLQVVCSTPLSCRHLFWLIRASSVPGGNIKS